MDKLKAALELLKDTCNKHFDWRENCPCVKCPLYYSGDYAQSTHCLTRSNLPCGWDIDEWEEQRETDGDSP